MKFKIFISSVLAFISLLYLAYRIGLPPERSEKQADENLPIANIQDITHIENDEIVAGEDIDIELIQADNYIKLGRYLESYSILETLKNKNLSPGDHARIGLMRYNCIRNGVPHEAGDIEVIVEKFEKLNRPDLIEYVRGMEASNAINNNDLSNYSTEELASDLGGKPGTINTVLTRAVNHFYTNEEPERVIPYLKNQYRQLSNNDAKNFALVLAVSHYLNYDQRIVNITKARELFDEND